MSKPKLAYLLAVDQVIQDTATNKYTYVGLFKFIRISKKTGFYYADFGIVGRIHDIKAGDVSAKIEIIGPDEKLFASVDLIGSTDSDESHLYGLFNSIKFSQPGIYSYQLTYKGQTYTLPGNTIEVVEV